MNQTPPGPDPDPGPLEAAVEAFRRMAVPDPPDNASLVARLTGPAGDPGRPGPGAARRRLLAHPALRFAAAAAAAAALLIGLLSVGAATPVLADVLSRARATSS